MIEPGTAPGRRPRRSLPGLLRVGITADPAPPVERRTFVIDTDRTALGVLGGEMRFDRHADDALALLRTRQGDGAPAQAAPAHGARTGRPPGGRGRRPGVRGTDAAYPGRPDIDRSVGTVPVTDASR